MNLQVRVKYGTFEQNLRQLVALSRHDIHREMETQGRSLFDTIIRFTGPFGGEGTMTMSPKAAQARGEASVAEDINKLFMSPGDFYAHLKKIDINLARAFWRVYKQNTPKKKGTGKAKAKVQTIGQWVNRHASHLVPSGVELMNWDEGKVAAARKQLRDRRGRTRTKKPVFMCWNRRAIKTFITKIKRNVGTLISGWGMAAAVVGKSLPGFATRNRPGRAAPAGTGSVRKQQHGKTVGFVLANNVSYVRTNFMEGDMDRVKGVMVQQERKLRIRLQQAILKRFAQKGYKAA